MAICINCHTTDKGFFAPRCHACNEECGFWLQVLSSLVYNTSFLLGMWLLLWAIFKIIG